MASQPHCDADNGVIAAAYHAPPRIHPACRNSYAFLLSKRRPPLRRFLLHRRGSPRCCQTSSSTVQTAVNYPAPPP
ncbi:hypothetical protein U1Q18_007616, partial [Sarracenia purpurea var. burkii]